MKGPLCRQEIVDLAGMNDSDKRIAHDHHLRIGGKEQPRGQRLVAKKRHMLPPPLPGAGSRSLPQS